MNYFRILFVLFLINYMNGKAQSFSYLAPNVSAFATQVSEEKTDDFASGQYGDYFYTTPRFVKGNAIQQFNRQSMELENRIVLQKKWDYRDKKLESDTLLYLSDGTILQLAVNFNKKRDQVEIYGIPYNEAGEKGRVTKLTSFAAKKESDVKVSAFQTDSIFVLYSLGGIEDKKGRIIECAWVKNDLELIKKQRTTINSPSIIDSYAYDGKRNILYLTTMHKEVSNVAMRIKSQRLIRFNMKEDRPLVKLLNFEDAYATVNAVAVDEKSGIPYLFGMGGPKKTKKLSAIYAIALDPKDLRETKKRFFQFSEKAIAQLIDSKKTYDALLDGNNTAYFKYNKALFAEGRIYVIFDNITYLGSRYGSYIVEFDADLSQTNQNYIAGYGIDNSESFVDNKGQLHLFFMAELKYFKKLYPSIKGADGEEEIKMGWKNSGLIRATLGGDKEPRVENMLVFDRENEVYHYNISHTNETDTGIELYLTAAKTYVTYNKIFIRSVILIN